MVVWAAGNASDNSGNVSHLTCDRQSGTNFTIGQTTVTCEAVDGSGNRAECFFLVVVTGNMFYGHFSIILKLYMKVHSGCV